MVLLSISLLLKSRVFFQWADHIKPLLGDVLVCLRACQLTYLTTYLWRSLMTSIMARSPGSIMLSTPSGGPAAARSRPGHVISSPPSDTLCHLYIVTVDKQYLHPHPSPNRCVCKLQFLDWINHLPLSRPTLGDDHFSLNEHLNV